MNMWRQDGDHGVSVYDASEASDAAEALKNGDIVDWCPGDSTRYTCQIVEGIGRLVHLRERYLVILNLGGPHVVPLTGRMWTAMKWARMSCLPTGCWAGMRPLLAALVYAEGSLVHQPADARQEAAERRRQYGDGEPLNYEDASLGREVRRVVEAQSREGTPVPQEENA